MVKQECYTSKDIRKSRFSVFALVPPAFLQSPEDIDEIAQEVHNYERHSSTGKTVHTPDRDIGDTLEYLAHSVYPGCGAVAITKNDWSHLAMGDSSMRTLESQGDRENYQMAA